MTNSIAIYALIGREMEEARDPLNIELALFEEAGTGCRRLFQVGAHNTYEVVGSFFRRFAVPRHMVANVVFHKFGHEAVDGSPCCREPLKDLCALFIIIQGAQNGLELSDNLLRAIDQIQLFS